MYPVIRARGRKNELVQKEFALGNGEIFEYLTFPILNNIEQIEHVFTTRMGGVSQNEFSTLNFSFVRGDNPDHVMENYRRVGEIFGKDCQAFVTTDQTHTTNIRVVGIEDAGKGVVSPRNYTDVDGLITNTPGVILSCFFADCVPLYFVDTVRSVIGLAHSGWRGTVAGMGACMVKRMQEEFGCRPEHIIAGIGTSICRDCYEVSEEVAEKFREGFWAIPEVKEYCKEFMEDGRYPSEDILVPGKAPGKWQLDLWLANMVVLRSAGIKAEHISVTDICTNCNAPYLFSHRATNGKRGNLGAFLMLKG